VTLSPPASLGLHSVHTAATTFGNRPLYAENDSAIRVAGYGWQTVFCEVVAESGGNSDAASPTDAAGRLNSWRPQMTIGHNAKTRLLCLAVTLLVPAVSQAGTWSAPTVLSSGGQGWQAAAAIDGTGNSVAVWDEITNLSQLWSRSKPSGGNWGAAMEVSPALEANSIYPAVRISAAGLATAVWSDQGGVWTADRPPASNWSSPRLLIPDVSNPIFVMNSQGAAAIVWSVGGPRSTSSQVLAVLRPAGGTWSAQQVVTSAVHVAPPIMRE
jgi:hypothetical protein